MTNARRWCAGVVLLVCGLAGSAVPAHATIIAFEAIDELDLSPGDDLWTYRFFVSDVVFDAGQGFSVYFDPTLYGAIQVPPPPVNTDWDVIALQPDNPPGAEGIYDALALVNGASLFDAFTVTFVWLGGGSPGPQAFTINEFDSAGGISFLETGVTTPQGATVPEPASWLLVALGIGTYAGRRCRQRPD